MAPIIRTEKLRKVYAVGKERVVALNNVDLSIEKGEFCCIVGQSGSGKSTLLNQLAGLEKPTSGKVYIGKHEISKMTENELAEFRQQHLGFIFQSYNLLPTMTAAAFAIPKITMVASCWMVLAMELAATGSPALYVICPRITACSEMATAHATSLIRTGLPYLRISLASVPL